MRLQRRNVLLLALVALLGGGDLALRAPTRGTGRAGRLLEDLDPERVFRVHLARSGGELDLQRTDTGWIVAQEQGFPAHERLVRGLLDRLASLSRTDLVARTPESVEEFGLGREATLVELADERGEVLASLVIGQPSALARGAYVRLEGEESVYRGANLPAVETEALRWLNTQLIELDPTRVSTITVERADPETELRLIRMRDGRWRVPGHERLLTARTVDPLLLQAANLYFVALAPPVAEELGGLRIRFELEGGGQRELRMGAVDAEGTYRASSAFWSGPWVALLDNSTGARLEAAIRRIEAGLDRE